MEQTQDVDNAVMENEAVKTDESDKSIILPENLIEKLIDIAISTARGILYVRLKGIIGQDAILPILSVKEIVKQFNIPDSKQKKSSPKKKAAAKKRGIG